MKTNSFNIPDDGELDRLLARRYRETSPEFEARWVALKRDLRQRPPARAWSLAPWRLAGWWGALGAAAAVALVIHFTSPLAPPSPVAPAFSQNLADLLTMDTVLGRAEPLLDEDNRLALLNLPAAAQAQN
ncbi:MAG: hypothetical protein WCL24_14740 [Verrucomicrobiota bacterium]